MELAKIFSWLIKIRKIVINTHIAFLSKKWAESIQDLANDYTHLEHDINKGHMYGKSPEIAEISNRLVKINTKTHKLWAEIKNKLKL